MTEPTDAEIVALADATRTAEGGAKLGIEPLPKAFTRYGFDCSKGIPRVRDCDKFSEGLHKKGGQHGTE